MYVCIYTICIIYTKVYTYVYILYMYIIYNNALAYTYEKLQMLKSI